ncbi:MAG: hypothetical protein HYX60_08115 [Legionella longbeachae]|nr:hypothetical protein [Legionella longbeachae]
MLKKIVISLSLIFGMNLVFAAAQTKPIPITKALIKKIAALTPDSSNAYQVEQMIGPASACLPNSIPPSETWICQWKGDLKSNHLLNTMNITFESGMIAHIVAIDANGDYIH